MQLKAIEAARYDDRFVVIRNPDNWKQELFTEEEFEIVKFLKKNEQESLLALLLPNIGVAKKDHIFLCMAVLRKLKRIQVVDYVSITGRKSLSNTATLEFETQKQKLELLGLRSLAALIFSLGERMLSWLGPQLLLLLVLIAAAFGFFFFPYNAVENALQVESLAYGKVFSVLYLTASLALCFRALLRGIFLKSLGRESKFHGISLYFPFMSLHSDCRDVNMEGYGARVRMAILGLVAPLALGAVFTILALTGKMELSSAFFAYAACMGVSLVLACPFFPADVAEILHVTFLRDELRERISSGLRDIFRTKGSLSREMLYALVATFLWLLAWLDSLRSFWDFIAGNVVADFASPSIYQNIGAGFLVATVLLLLLFPVGIFSFSFLRERFSSQKRRIVVQKEKIKDSLSFEERMSALEKIPLFTYLNDQERLALLNEMQPMFYGHREFLMHQGEVGKEFFVLVRGHANAYFTDVHGRNYLLADLGEGDAFGEIALIDDVPRTASIRSDGGCIVLMLKKEGFDRFAQSLGSPDRVKTLIRLTSFFRRHPLFSKLKVKDQAQLIDRFRFQTLTAGDAIPNGEDDFYVVYSGKVRLDTGDDAADVTLQADDCFGYANVLNANYFAAEGTGLLIVKREEFHSLIWEKLVEHPELFI